MFGRETFIARAADGGAWPAVATGDYLWVDPDEPALHGRLVAVDAGCGDAAPGTVLVREYLVEDGVRVLRAPAGPDADIALDVDNETMLLGVVVFRGRGV